MTDDHLDRAIVAAKNAAWKQFGFDPADLEAGDTDRTYARALIAELLRGMDVSDLAVISPTMVWGFNAAIFEIKARAGLEDEG